jgi:phosphoglycerol transferase MdoB-like AlkP superfamily enzyme
MGMLLFAAMAKANDHFNKPWLFAGIYVAIMFFLGMLFPSATKTFGSILLNLGFAFVVLGILFSLLHRYQDSILVWLGILFAGLFILSGGAKLMLGEWVQ